MPDIDEIKTEAVELVRAQHRRDIRFRLNLILVVLLVLVSINIWRVYRNEKIWLYCVNSESSAMQELMIFHKEMEK